MNYTNLSVTLASIISNTKIAGNNGPITQVTASFYTTYMKNGVAQNGWLKALAFGKLADALLEYPANASMIIEGPLSAHKVTSQGGTVSTYPVVNITKFTPIPTYFTYSSVTIQGRMGQDPEYRALESGSTVSNFSLAVNSKGKNSKNEPPHWFRCEAWGNTADVVTKFCRKGKQVGVVGTLRFDNYVSRTTNEPACNFQIRVDQLTLGSDAKGARDNDVQQAAPSVPSAAPTVSSNPFAQSSTNVTNVVPTDVPAVQAESVSHESNDSDVFDSIPF